MSWQKNSVNYLTKEQILLIHSILIDETGGSHGVRDHNAILALEGLPRQSVFGKELYPTVFLKAAVYCRNILFNHPFFDGNKRTGMTTAGIFLENNGYHIIAQEGQIEKFALEIIRERYDVQDIARWLKINSKKRKMGR